MLKKDKYNYKWQKNLVYKRLLIILQNKVQLSKYNSYLTKHQIKVGLNKLKNLLIILKSKVKSNRYNNLPNKYKNKIKLNNNN